MFKTRLLSGIVLVAVALLTIISGGYVLFFTLLGISLIGMQEPGNCRLFWSCDLLCADVAGF